VANFSAFTIKYRGRSHRITTPVKLTAAFDPQRPPDPLPSQFETVALWDTGATNSVVTQATAAALGLVPVGNASVTHAGGSSQVNTYLVNFILPNSVGVAGVMVSECPDIAGNFGAIVGMDIISSGDLAITNVDGQTWMSFRYPSIQALGRT
jgi:hypothetical protein